MRAWVSGNVSCHAYFQQPFIQKALCFHKAGARKCGVCIIRASGALKRVFCVLNIRGYLLRDFIGKRHNHDYAFWLLLSFAFNRKSLHPHFLHLDLRALTFAIVLRSLALHAMQTYMFSKLRLNTISLSFFGTNYISQISL